MIRRLATIAALTVAPALAAQNAAPLAPYAGTKVAVVPVQFYHADSSGWGAPAGPVLRAAFDSLLSEIAEFYEREIDYEIKGLNAQIEPILTIVMGVLVAILALGESCPCGTWDPSH